MKSRLLFSAAALVAAFASAQADTPVHGIDIAAMDKATAPGDDFYGYANAQQFLTQFRQHNGAKNAYANLCAKIPKKFRQHNGANCKCDHFTVSLVSESANMAKMPKTSRASSRVKM